MKKNHLLKRLVVGVIIAFFFYPLEIKAQLYETEYVRNKAMISYSDKTHQIHYITDHMLSGYNRKEEQFIFKIPLDTLLNNLANRGGEINSPSEKNYLTIFIHPENHSAGLDNFDGESLDLKCEVAYLDRSYNETAQFRAFFNDDDQMISASFSIRITIRDRDWFDIPSERGEYAGEIAITATEAMVPVKSNY